MIGYSCTRKEKTCIELDKKTNECMGYDVNCRYQKDLGLPVKIKKINPLATIPTRGSDFSAGYDLYACLENPVVIQPNATVKIPIGIAVELPQGTFGAIYARSGLATKCGLRPANCVGVCDEDYRGEYIVALHNDSGAWQEIKNGDRIAQLIVSPYIAVNFVEVKDLNDTERGENGFGSTGK